MTPNIRPSSTGMDRSSGLYAFDLCSLTSISLFLARSRPARCSGKHLRKAPPAVLCSELLEGRDGAAMFRHACGLVFEGIVSQARLETRAASVDAR